MKKFTFIIIPFLLIAGAILTTEIEAKSLYQKVFQQEKRDDGKSKEREEVMNNFFKQEMKNNVPRKSSKLNHFGDQYLLNPIKKVFILTREYQAFYYLENYYWMIHELYWSLPRKYKFIRKCFPNFILYIMYLYFIII